MTGDGERETRQAVSRPQYAITTSRFIFRPNPPYHPPQPTRFDRIVEALLPWLLLLALASIGVCVAIGVHGFAPLWVALAVGIAVTGGLFAKILRDGSASRIDSLAHLIFLSLLTIFIASFLAFVFLKAQAKVRMLRQQQHQERFVTSASRPAA
jgi:hypothetical protein